jgi:hypothetical protein
MRQSQLPLLGLLFALFVGARVGNLGGASETELAKNSAGKSVHVAASGTGSATVHSGTRGSPRKSVSTSDSVQNGCDELSEFSKAGTLHISEAQRTTSECLPRLSAIYDIICQLNPPYSSNSTFREGLEREELKMEKPTLPQCLTTWTGADKPMILAAIASVPDPERTHLGLLTDRTIEAIQDAAGRAGYNPYSHFLPWPASEAQGGSEDSQANGEANEHQPGVMVFKKQDSPAPHGASAATRQYLVVFVIPELPTSGLDQESFFRARTTIQEMETQLGQTENTVWFSGPNFSGSLASLKEIDRGIGESTCIRAFSGQVTAATYFKRKSSCESQLVLTQTPDCVAVPALVNGLAEFYGYRPEEIALLSEGGTAYGKKANEIAADDLNESAQKSDPAKKHAEAANVDPACSDIAGLLSLQFPREISKLRNAYGAVANPTPTNRQNDQSSDLQLSWEDAEARRGDDMPEYGGRQTPLSQEAVLSTLSNALKARKIRALGILATDPMDVAFLIHSFRKSSPDVRLFLRDPDLLYLRTPDVGSLNGTLLVNNYPMILRNQLWSRDSTAKTAKTANADGLVTFPSAGQEAEFNAFLLLLQSAGPAEPQREVGEWYWPASLDLRQSTAEVVDWNWPAGRVGARGNTLKLSEIPPLWLTTMGTTGHFPLALLNVDKSSEANLRPQFLDVGGPRHIGMVLWICFAVLGLAHLWGLSWPDALPRLFSDDFDLSDQRDTITASKASCHVVILLSLALSQLVLGSSYVFFRSLEYHALLTAAVIAIAYLLMFGACMIFMSSIVRPWRWFREGVKLRNDKLVDIRRPFFSGLFGIVIFAALGVIWVAAVFQPTFRNAFLHFRNLILGGGVAPCVPIVMLLLVMFLAAWAYLRRLTYWGYRRPQLPTMPLDDTFPSDFSGTVRLIDHCILGFLESRSWSIGFGVVFVAAVFAFRPKMTLDMTEVLPLRRIIMILFVLAFFVLGLNWFRFANIWFRLRNLLEGLERLPIWHAFERMPAEASMPIWRWGISDNSFMPACQTIERLRALIQADKTAVSALSIQELRWRITNLGKFKAQKKQGIWRIFFSGRQGRNQQLVVLPQVVGGSPRVVSVQAKPTFGELLNGVRQAMTEIVHQLIVLLRPTYWQRGSDGSKPEVPAPLELKRFLLAEDLVAMRYYMYVRYVVTELRNLLFFVAMAFSLIFLAFHTYAFRADQAIDWSFLVLFLILGTGVVVVLYQMELDPILSHFGGKQPGEVGWSFYLNLLKYGAVPMLTIIGSQVPAVSNLLLRWVQPTLESLR